MNNKEKENMLYELHMIEDYIDDLIKKVSYQVNISEHTGDIRKLIRSLEHRIKHKIREI